MDPDKNEIDSSSEDILQISRKEYEELVQKAKRLDEMEESMEDLEIELESARERFVEMFHRHSSIRLLIDHENHGTIVDANIAACDFYGYSRDELLSHSIYEIDVRPDDSVASDMERAHHARQSHFYVKHRISSGEIRDVEIHASPIVIQGNILLFFIIHDITARVRAETALKENEERFRLLSEVPFEGIAVTIGGVIVDVNKRLCNMFGYNEMDVIGNPAPFLFVPESRTEGSQFIERTDSNPYETMGMKKSGESFPIEVRTRLVESGGNTLRVSAVRDITEQKRAQLAVEKSEKKYRTLINSTNEGFMLIDKYRKTADVNDSLCRMIGYTRQEILGKNPVQFITESRQDSFMEKIRTIEYTDHRIYESLFKHRDGREVPVIIYATTLKDQQGKPDGSFGFVADITPLKEAEHLVEENLLFLQTVIDAIPAAVFYKDEEGYYKGCNTDFEKMIGRSRDELIGQSVYHLLSEDEAKRFEHFDNTVIETGQSVSYEETLKFGDKPERDYLIFKSPYYKKGGEAGGVVGVALDITERKIIEKQLRILNDHLEDRVEEEASHRLHNQRKYEFIFSNVNDGMLLLTPDGSVETVFDEANSRACEILGYTHEEITGTPLVDKSPGKAHLMAIREIGLYMMEQNLIVHETEICRKDDQWISVEISISKFELNGKPVLLMAIRDIQERLGLEREKKIQEQMLIQQSKMAELGEMVGAIAHQWKQPLNNIGMMVQDLDEAYNFGEMDDDYVSKFSRDSFEQIQYLIGTIDDFRRFFRPGSDKTFFQLQNAVDDILRLIGTQMKNHRVQIHMNYQSDAPIKVYGPANEFKHVLLNLMNNSKDAIEELRAAREDYFNGVINIDVKSEGEDVYITIKDNGGGIREDLLPHLFKPFVTSKGENGTGIGLYMAQNIIERNMKGGITAGNTDTGACFTIRLRHHRDSGLAGKEYGISGFELSLPF